MPTSIGRILSEMKAQQRRLMQIDAQLTRVIFALELLGYRPECGIKGLLLQLYQSLSLHQLHGRGEMFPVEACAQDVVAVDDLLESAEVTIQQRSIGKHPLRE